MLSGDFSADVVNLVGDEESSAGVAMPDSVINKLLDLVLK
jgi:hypothetical protein